MLTIPANMIDLEGIEAGDNLATAEAINVLVSALNSLLSRQRSILPKGVRTAEITATGVSVGLMEGGDTGTNTDQGIGIELDATAELPGGLADVWRLISGRDAIGAYLGLFNSSWNQGIVKFHFDGSTMTMYPDTSGNSVNADFHIGGPSTQRWDEGWFNELNVSDGMTLQGSGLGTWQAYIPTFTGTGSNPSGFSLTGRYTVIGRTVRFWARVQPTSLWTPGTGAYRISLPVAVGTNGLVGGTWVGLDTGTAFYTGTLQHLSTTQVSAYYVDSGTPPAASELQEGGPFTLANNDILWWHGTYEVD